MSFILDALKKSESDRQRQTGPALFEVKVAPPRARFPVWAVAIAALLVINMGIVGWMLLRRSSHGEEAPASNTSTAAASATPPASNGGFAAGTATSSNARLPSVTAPASTTPASTSESVSGGALPAAPTSAGTLPSTTASAGGLPSTGNGQPLNAPPAVAQTGVPQPGATSGPPSNRQPYLPERDQNEPTLGGNGRESGGGNTDPAANPDDYAPAADPGTPLFKGHVRRGTESGLVLYQDAALVPGSNIPQLRLDLHVYAAKPQDRFALINMHKLHEGDSLQGGVRVESITPDGVVMSHNGSRFLLPRD